MGNVAIRIAGLGKRYRLGQWEPHRSLRDVFAEAVAAPFRRRGAAEDEYFWALKDLSFEVRRGTVVGIIGRNGAGKSTLLKILSRITRPTEGRAEIQGRVSSLLEVGTGFHPELSGRENVYLNGAILGMRRAEINRKFDEIVAFAEVEKFLDMPVKRYSSGMYMRLAFAVAAHLEPDILLVDEVLAVGDAAFQKKCLGQMGKVVREGRTIVFVSHNMLAVENLCDAVIWLDAGRVDAAGPPGTVIARYLLSASSMVTQQEWGDSATAPGNDKVRLRRVCVRPAAGSPSDPITVRTPFVMEFEYQYLGQGGYLNLSANVYSEQGILVFSTAPVGGAHFSAGLYRDTCRVPGDLLNDGRHWVEVEVVENQTRVVFSAPDVLVFDVLDSVDLRGYRYDRWNGVVRPTLVWSTERLDGADGRTWIHPGGKASSGATRARRETLSE